MDQELRQKSTERLNLSGGNLFLLSLGSALLYGSVGVLIFRYVLEYSPLLVFDHGFSWEIQLLLGLFAGAICAGAVNFLIKKSPIQEVLDDFHIIRILSRMELGWFDRIQLSVFAGIAEEFLFRGALQVWVGIWLTSLIFVGLHGYFRFKSIGHLLFGVIFFSLSMILGWLFEYAGLITAMTAHMIYDVIMLTWLQKNSPPRKYGGL